MKRATLVDALTRLFPAVAKNPVVEEEGDFRLNGKILRAMDGKTLIQVLIDEDTGLDCRVPAAPFFKYLRAIRDEDIDIVLVGSELTVKAGRKRYRVPVALEGGALDAMDLDGIDWEPIPESLLEGVRRCRFAASKDSARGTLVGVRIHESFVTAANAFRIAAFELPGSATAAGASLVLTQELATQLARYETDIQEWAVKGDVVFFKVGGSMIIVAKTISGPYPDVLKWVREEAGPTIPVELPEDMKDSLRRHEAQQSDEALLDQEVVLSFREGLLTVESEGRDGSYMATDEFDVDVNGKEMKFKIHPGFLADILDETRMLLIGDGHVRFKIGGFDYLTSTETV